MTFKATSRAGGFSLATLIAITAVQVKADSGLQPPIEEIVVRAHLLSTEGLAQPTAVLDNETLKRVAAVSIGETLIDLPGIQSSSFGQAVGRPVIRGLGGPRVKTMEDRIDSLDVSVSSPDHMVTVEPFTADSIEVLKGPSTLLYGNGAIGGVVDVHTGRIPHEIPESLSASLELREGDNADHRTVAGRVDGGSGNIAFHFDGFYRDAGSYDIPGFAESDAQRALEAADEDHDDHGEHEEDDHEDHNDEGHDGHSDEEEYVYGNLPGSELEAEGGAFGLSWVGDRGFIGVSVSSYDAKYGLPGHSHHHHEEHGHEDEHGEEHHDDEHDDEHDDDHHDEDEHGGDEGTPVLDMAQTRIDLEAGLKNPFEGIRSINFRMGLNDYEHIEFEAGQPGTTFSTEAIESRLEIVHEEISGITGAAGIQVSTREFSAIGFESFVQPVDTDTIGVFYVGQLDLGDGNLEAGVRYEQVEHDPTAGRSRDFNLGAASLGLIQPIGESWTLKGQIDYSSRAPVAEELFSFGPHISTQSFEIGDDRLDEETAGNLSATLGYASERLDISVSAYITDFGDFIYQAGTGVEMDELPVQQWKQADARFQGLELSAAWRALNWPSGSLAFSAGYDHVKARLKKGADRDLPRITPQRWRLGAILNWSNLLAEVSWRRVDEQNDVAFGELPSEAYSDLRVHLGYTMEMGETTIEWFVNGRNLTDDEQRYHTSFIKDLAPQPGRTIEGGVRIQL